jgi:hypothetical protein
LSEGKAKFVPDVLVAGGGNGGALDGLAATAMRLFGSNGGNGGGVVAAAKPAAQTIVETAVTKTIAKDIDALKP